MHSTSYCHIDPDDLVEIARMDSGRCSVRIGGADGLVLFGSRLQLRAIADRILAEIPEGVS